MEFKDKSEIDKFIKEFICKICDYAVLNELEPDYCVKYAGQWLLFLTSTSTFNNWKITDKEKE